MDISKYKTYIKNVSVSDDELSEIINTVVKDIAISTNFFKRLYGFSIEKDLLIYDFKHIAYLNQEVLPEVISISTSEPTQEQIVELLSTNDFTTLNTIENTTGDINLEELLNVINIFDDNGFNSENLFMFETDTRARLKNNPSDTKELVFIGSVIPNIDKITDSEENKLKKTLIEGIKYFVLDTVVGSQDINTANLYFQRYEMEKNKLINTTPYSYFRINQRNKFKEL